MAKPKVLKVFRTPIGFHDAYVAAPSKKAALEAWGSHRNLFAIGEAEQVSDQKLMRAPLATPGAVVKVSRGTVAEQLNALPIDEKTEAKTPPPENARRGEVAKPRKLAPRPSRAALDRAEAALVTAKAADAKVLAAIDDKIADLHARRDAAVATQAEARKTREAALDRAQTAYETELEQWRSML